MAGKKKERPPIAVRILNGLAELDDVQCRPMFGCLGLYSEGVFFGIVSGDDLFFRTDDASRPKYIKRGMEYFEFRDNQKSRNYFRVPPAVIDSPPDLCRWAREAIRAQRDRKGK